MDHDVVVSLIADPWVLSSIPAWLNTFVEIDDEIFQEGLLSVASESIKCTEYWLTA